MGLSSLQLDLARSDFHLFERLKRQITGKRFVEQTSSVQEAVVPWLQTFDTDLFTPGNRPCWSQWD